MAALRSALAQRDVNLAEIIVVVDGDIQDLNTSSAMPEVSDCTAIRYLSSGIDNAAIHDNPLLEHYQPARIARSRNVGVAAAVGEALAHLDDDNIWEPEHLARLAARLSADPSLDAVHSWRRILWPDGTPYRTALYPWLKQPEVHRAATIYSELVKAGIFREGDCVMRDCFKDENGELFLTVDSSEWLIRTRVHLRYRFNERPSFRELSHCLSDDYLFARVLAQANVRVGCTMAATLRYYLGGRSTSWLLEHRRDEVDS